MELADSKPARVLLAGEPGEGPLVSRPPNKPHGWIRIQDATGNQHSIYVPPNELANHQVGELLSFTVLVSDRGASATNVERGLLLAAVPDSLALDKYPGAQRGLGNG